MKNTSSAILNIALTTAVLSPAMVNAQNALEEVVVTATKRDAGLSDLSVAANVKKSQAANTHC